MSFFGYKVTFDQQHETVIKEDISHVADLSV